MLLSWTAFAFLLLAVLIAWFWQDSLAARESANAAAIDACERLSLQFLDGTVAFARIVLFRAPSGWISLRRTYVFDYTANSIERLQGFVVLRGHQIETVGYASAGTPPTSNVMGTIAKPAAMPTGSAEVLDLAQWRASNQRTAPSQRNALDDRGEQRH